MICPNCGKQNSNEEKYCLYCGRDLEKVENKQYFEKNQPVKPALNDGILRDPLGYENLNFSYGFYLLIALALYFGKDIVALLVAKMISSIVTATHHIPHSMNISLFSNILVTILSVILLCFILRKHIKPILKKFISSKTWLKALAYLGIIYAAIFAYGIIMTVLRINQTSANQDSIDAMTKIAPFLSGLYVCILAPILEEIIFRFGLFRSLLKFGKKAAVIIVAFIFAGMHLIASLEEGTLLADLTSLPVYLIGGISLTVAYCREKDIAVSICIHFMYNSLGFLMSLALFLI